MECEKPGTNLPKALEKVFRVGHGIVRWLPGALYETDAESRFHDANKGTLSLKKCNNYDEWRKKAIFVAIKHTKYLSKKTIECMRMSVDLIFQCPLCNAIPVSERESFLKDTKFFVKRYSQGDVVVSQGVKYEHLYILISGKMKTEMADEKGDFMHIETIEAPGPLSTGFLFATDNLSPVTAIAQTDCVAVIIPKENIYELMRKYEGFMKAFLSYISNRVAFLSEKLRLVSLRTIRAKLAYYLLKESRGEDCFRLRISKEALSHLLGVSRPALVNVLMQMADEGNIEVNGRDITICNRPGLQRMF